MATFMLPADVGFLDCATTPSKKKNFFFLTSEISASNKLRFLLADEFRQ